MQAGKLDRRITLQRPSTTRGELGGQITTWAAVATVWANIRDLTGRETFAAQAAGSHVSQVISIRHRTDIDATCRVLMDSGRIGKIAWIAEIGRRAGLQVFIEVQE